MYVLLANEKQPEKDRDFSSHCSYYFSASKDFRPYFSFWEVFFGRERGRERFINTPWYLPEKLGIKSIKWPIFPFLGYIPYQKTHIKELEDRIEHLRELKVPVKDSSAELEPPGAGYPGGASTSERRNRDRPGR